MTALGETGPARPKAMSEMPHVVASTWGSANRCVFKYGTILSFSKVGLLSYVELDMASYKRTLSVLYLGMWHTRPKLAKRLQHRLKATAPEPGRTIFCKARIVQLTDAAGGNNGIVCLFF